MGASYTTLDSVILSYMGNWKAEWDEKVEHDIPLVSSMIRAEFKDRGRDLDAELASGKTEAGMVELVANTIITRPLASYWSNIPMMGDFKAMSASAGPLSMSITPGDSSGYYFKKAELKQLGLKSIAMGRLVRRYYTEPRDPRYVP